MTNIVYLAATNCDITQRMINFSIHNVHQGMYIASNRGRTHLHRMISINNGFLITQDHNNKQDNNKMYIDRN